MVAHQSPCPWGFSRQEYWSGLPWPPPGDLPDPGIEPESLMFPALASVFFTTSATWEAQATHKGGFCLFKLKSYNWPSRTHLELHFPPGEHCRSHQSATWKRALTWTRHVGTEVSDFRPPKWWEIHSCLLFVNKNKDAPIVRQGGIITRCREGNTHHGEWWSTSVNGC